MLKHSQGAITQQPQQRMKYILDAIPTAWASILCFCTFMACDPQDEAPQPIPSQTTQQAVTSPVYPAKSTLLIPTQPARVIDSTWQVAFGTGTKAFAVHQDLLNETLVPGSWDEFPTNNNAGSMSPSRLCKQIQY